MKNFREFINESAKVKHPLEDAFTKKGFFKNIFKSPSAFHRMEAEIPNSLRGMRLEGSLGYFSTSTWVMSTKNDSVQTKQFETTLLDNNSVARFLLAIDESFLGEEWEETEENIKTMLAYTSEPAEDVIKYAGRWGYKPYYTFIIFRQYTKASKCLLVTFVPDEEVTKKYRGTIQGRRFGLSESQALNENSDTWMTETFEKPIIEFEKRLEKEIPGYDHAEWWEKMMELDQEAYFDMDLEAAYANWSNEMYFGKFNSEIDGYETTPEYDRVKAEVYAKHKDYEVKRRELNQELFKNAVEKHWSEWKAIYQKWIDFVYKKRGSLAGKKYNL